MGLTTTLVGLLPATLAARLRAARRRLLGIPSVGRVNMGDLRRLTPVSADFGFDRGQPIDRYYIEGFLAKRSGDIRGRVLEIGDNEYTLRYGGERVQVSEILHVTADNPKATIIGDLASAPHIPDDTFDAIVLTQTLLLIYDLRAAVETLHRILKPGGVLLVTVPGIVPVPVRSGWSQTWCWSFTEYSLRRLLAEQFPPEHMETTVHGNVLAAVSLLEGLATTELNKSELDFVDTDYPVTITARAVKAGSA